MTATTNRVGGVRLALPGSMWRHYKGGVYVVVTLVQRESTLTVEVVYEAVLGGKKWVRPLDEWLSTVDGSDGQMTYRYERIS